MEFDESRVYTTVNADKLKIGSRVIVADTLKDLKNKVKMGGYVTKLLSIESDDVEHRFCIDGNIYVLAYLVSEPEEKKLKWTDLKVGDVISNGDMECMVVTIDKRPNAFFRVCIITHDGLDWLSLSNDGVKDWEKVEK